MPDTSRVGLDHDTLLAFQKQYHTQKRLTESLFGLFRTLGSSLDVERVANVGLLTLTGQLLIKCAGFLQRHGSGYRMLSTVGTHDPRLLGVDIPASHPLVGWLFQSRTLLDLATPGTDHPGIGRLRAHGFGHLFPLADGTEPLGLLALGPKIVPGPFAAEDLQILNAFGVVMSVSLKHSLAFQLVEASRNEVERLNEMKREFLAHVSHEFRTPLTVLKNIFEMVDVPAEIGEMHHSALGRLENLIDSLLLLNEINSRGMKLEPQLLQASTWVRTQIEPLLERYERFELKSDLGTGMLEFDSFKVGKALEVLLSNASKFGGDSSVEIVFYRSTRTHVVGRMQDVARAGNGRAGRSERGARHRSQGPRHRHPAQRDGRRLPAVHAGRQLADARRARRRARPGDGQAHRRRARRRAVLPQRGRARHDFLRRHPVRAGQPALTPRRTHATAADLACSYFTSTMRCESTWPSASSRAT
jgi:hypothetical protein